MSSTVVTEFDLICENLPWLPTISSTYMIGVILIWFSSQYLNHDQSLFSNQQVVIFNSIGGLLADRYGRRRVMLILAVVHVIASFVTALAGGTSYTMFVVAR